jgi:streptogrisin C
MKTRIWATCAVAATIAVGSPAAAQPTVDEETATAQDIALIAAANGWGLAVTSAHMQAQETLSGLADRLARQFPARYAGAVLAEQPGGTSVISFKGEVPPAAEEQAAAAGIPVDLRGGRPESVAELGARAAAIARHLGTRYAEVGAAVLPDGWIEVAVSGGPAPVPELPAELAARTRITLAPGPVVQPEDVIGGTWLEDSDAFECTGGFTVVDNATGETGLATAGHCNGLDEWDSPIAGVADVTLTFEDEDLGAYGDVQWHSSSDVEPDDFYADSLNNIRDVSSVVSTAGFVVNGTHCVYGRASNNRECDQVYSTWAITFVGGTLIDRLVMMDDDNTVPGDSGGNWSYSNTAAGIHQGDVWLPFKQHNVFSKASLLPSALGVSVRT